MKKLKNMAVLSLATALLVVPMTSKSFADSSTIVSEEWIGIEVSIPNFDSKSNDSESRKTSVSGGWLWAEWNGGTTFRAKYDHGSKEHRSSATNDLGSRVRSSWVPKGKTATSPWLTQTLSNNKVWASTR